MATNVKLDGPRAFYVVIVLTVAYSLAYVDRNLLNLLVDPIRRTLALTDTQFSVVQGTAFVAAYLLAIPVFGRLTDVTNRRNILIFGVSCWSICTALCGRAHSFEELFAARFGVGVSEACVFPVSWSLIGDYFTHRRAPRAFSIFTLGSQVGGALSLVAGGLVIAFAGNLRNSLPALGSLETWQMAFVVVGVPGLLMIPILLTVREPVRRANAVAGGVSQERMKLSESAAVIWSRRSFYLRIYLGIGMLAVIQLGVPAWFPSFLIRAYGLSREAVGYKIGSLWIISASTSILLGPVIARWLERRGHADAPLRVAAFSAAATAACCAALPLTGNADGALAVSAALMFFSSFPLSLIAHATQLATPSRMRGLVSGLYTFSTQSLGYGLAPTGVALITDNLFHDPKMVGFSLQIVTTTAAAVYALAMFTVLPVFRKFLEGAPKQAEAVAA